MIDGIIFFLMAWGVLCVVTFMFITGNSKFWEKHVINFYLPKSKKYETRNSPIYKIEQSEYDGIRILKYSLKYSENHWVNFFSIFLLYPIRFNIWKYTADETIFLSDKKEEIEKTLGNKSLRDYYEDVMTMENEKRRKENEESEKIENIMGNLNQEFNENYI